MARPELRLFYTYAMWNDAARTASVDSGNIYRQFDSDVLSGTTVGLQAKPGFESPRGCARPAAAGTGGVMSCPVVEIGSLTVYKCFVRDIMCSC